MRNLKSNETHKLYVPSSRVSKSYKPPVVVIYGDVDDEAGGGGGGVLLGGTSSFTLWVMDQPISPDDLGAPLRRLVDMSRYIVSNEDVIDDTAL